MPGMDRQRVGGAQRNNQDHALVRWWHGSRWGRRATWAVGIVLLTWLAAWLGVPPLVKYGLQHVASEKLGRAVSVGQVDFRPWSLELTLDELALSAADGETPQLQVGRAHVNAGWQSLFRLGPVLDAVQIDEPVLTITHAGEGRYDVDDILRKLGGQPEAPASSPLAFALYNIELRGGRIEFRDTPKARVHQITDLQLSLPFIANLDSKREVKVVPHLAFQLNGSPFDSRTEATPFADDRQTQARFRLDDLDLAPYAAYLPAGFPVTLQSGRLGLDLRLAFTELPKTRLEISGQVEARQLVLKDRQGADLLALDGLRAQLAEVSPLQGSARIGSVVLDGPDLRVTRDAQGVLNLLRLASPAPAGEAVGDATPDGASQDGPGWTVALDQLAIERGTVHWDDAGVPGGAHARLGALQVQARQITWPVGRPLQFSGTAEVATRADPSAAAALLTVEGQADGRTARASVSLDGLDVAGLNPYLAQALRLRLAGRLSGSTEVDWSEPGLAVKVAKLELRQGVLACLAAQACGDAARLVKLPARTAATFDLLQVADAQVDLARRQADVGQLKLDGARALITRDEQGRWMVEHWLPQPHADAAPAARTDSGGRWDVHLGEIAVRQADLGYRDEATASPVAFAVSDLSLDLKDVSPLADRTARASPFQLSARIGAGRADPGRLVTGGTLALQPLAVNAKLSATRVPLHAVVPYVASALNIDIRRADTGFKGDVAFRQTAAGNDLRVSGDAMVDDFRSRTAAGTAPDGAPAGLAGIGGDADPLLNWKSLALQGIDVRLQPGRPLMVDVQRTSLSDFFARIVVQENGRLNLQDLFKPTEPASGDEAPAGDAPPVIRFGPVEVANGTVAFADRFIKPNYSADITQLTGQLSAFSSQAPEGQAQPLMADIALGGLVQGTATLDVTGRLNPLAQPLALDIAGHVTGLELPALSPYSVKYAGHGIERGKMSMDVNYKVLPDGQLTASNRLVLNQLAFGDQVEDAPASLPVRLATALLSDRHGVIDVNLPISGSLNDPAFSLGGLIFKAIANLIVKAVTAPFSLLAGALGGDGADASVVRFAPGVATLDEAAKASLDKVAQALADRPRLRMTVVGQADLGQEQAAWKQAQLQRMALAEKRRQAARAGGNPSQVAAVEAAEYPDLLRQVYRRADIQKPRNLIGLAKDIPVDQMEALLTASIAVPADAMNALAVARAVAVRDHLAGRGVPLDRLFLGAVKLGAPAGDGADGWVPQAQLTLAVN